MLVLFYDKTYRVVKIREQFHFEIAKTNYTIDIMTMSLRI